MILSPRMIELASVSIGTAKKVLREIRGESAGLKQLRPRDAVRKSMYVPKATPAHTDIGSLKRKTGWNGLAPHMVVVPRQTPELRVKSARQQHLPMSPANRRELENHAQLNDPIDASLHEHGHVTLPKKTKTILKNGEARARSEAGIPITHPYFKTAVNEEYRANRDILERIRTHGTPQEAKAWRARAQMQIKEGYRKPMFNNALMDEVTRTGAHAITEKGHLPLSLKRRVLQKHPHLRQQELSAKTQPQPQPQPQTQHQSQHQSQQQTQREPQPQAKTKKQPETQTNNKTSLKTNNNPSPKNRLIAFLARLPQNHFAAPE